MVCYGSALCSAGPGPWIWEGRRAGGGAAQGHSLEMKSKGGGRPRSLQTSDRRAKGVREFVTGKPGETISSSAQHPLLQVNIKPPQVCPAHPGLTGTGSLVPRAEDVPIHISREPGSPREVPGAGNGRHRSLPVL